MIWEIKVNKKSSESFKGVERLISVYLDVFLSFLSIILFLNLSLSLSSYFISSLWPNFSLSLSHALSPSFFLILSFSLFASLCLSFPLSLFLSKFPPALFQH